MQCPYCGEEMLSGKLTGDGRALVRFEQEGKKLDLFEKLWGTNGVTAQKSRLGRFAIPAEYCPRCEKMIFDTKLAK